MRSKNQIVTIYLPLDVLNAIDKIADEELRSRSGMISIMLQKQLDIISSGGKPHNSSGKTPEVKE